MSDSPISRRQRICVYMGSRSGHDPAFRQVAHALGTEIGAGGRTLVYGGASVGLMGIVSAAVTASGGRTVGFLPRILLEREIAEPKLTELHIVEDMHTRKARMIAAADAFIALPGGFGTLDELFECLTWAQLGLHHAPIGLLDANGYFDSLLAFIAHAARAGFIPPEQERLVLHDVDPSGLLRKLDTFVPL